MPAEVLELADRHDSGSCVGNDVWVQVPSSALKINLKDIKVYFFVLLTGFLISKVFVL